MSRLADTDDEREPASAAGGDPGSGILDGDRPLRTRTESARGLQQDGRIRLAGQAQLVGHLCVDADREHVGNPGGGQDPITVAAGGVDGGCDTGILERSRHRDRRVDNGNTVNIS